MDEKDIEKIIKKHELWLFDDPNGVRADLRNADLRGAYLRGANLEGSNLENADLMYANLRHAHLEGAHLEGSDLRHAHLEGAHLEGAYLIGSNLEGADLEGSNLYKTYFDKSNTFRKGKILTENILGYKKCRGNIIVTLKIPRGAIVFGINNNKFRTNIATVVSIEGGAKTAYSLYNEKLSYHIGDTITVYNFNCEYNVECGEGIHFFMTKEEAEAFHWY